MSFSRRFICWFYCRFFNKLLYLVFIINFWFNHRLLLPLSLCIRIITHNRIILRLLLLYIFPRIFCLLIQNSLLNILRLFHLRTLDHKFSLPVHRHRIDIHLLLLRPKPLQNSLPLLLQLARLILVQSPLDKLIELDLVQRTVSKPLAGGHTLSDRRS